MRVDRVVVLRVVFMARGRNEDRVQIDAPDPEALQIIQFMDHALQIAARERAGVVRPGRVRPVSVDVRIFIRQHVIVRVSVREAVHEDLVEHAALRPLRHAESGNDLEILPGVLRAAGIRAA